MSKRAELRLVWSKRERDIVYHFDKRKQDGHLLHNLFTYGVEWVTKQDGDGDGDGLAPMGRTVERFRAELDRRGYDPDTFTISVRRKKPAQEKLSDD